MSTLIVLERDRKNLPLTALQVERLLGARRLAPGLYECDAPCPEALWARLAGVKVGLTPLAFSPDPDELVAKVAALKLDTEGFRIDVLEVGTYAQRCGSGPLVTALGMAVEAYPDLKNPTCRLILVESPIGYHLTTPAHPRPSLGRPPYERRPQGSCAGLPTIMAAAAVNLVASPGDRLVDPTCGSGTIVYEALIRGVHAQGFDKHWRWAKATRENLAFFGLEAPPEGFAACADAMEVVFEADAVVANLPYNRRAKTTDAILDGIVRNLRGQAKRFAFFAGAPLSERLREAGYQVDIELDISSGPATGRFFVLATPN